MRSVLCPFFFVLCESATILVSSSPVPLLKHHPASRHNFYSTQSTNAVPVSDVMSPSTASFLSDHPLHIIRKIFLCTVASSHVSKTSSNMEEEARLRFLSDYVKWIFTQEGCCWLWHNITDRTAVVLHVLSRSCDVKREGALELRIHQEPGTNKRAVCSGGITLCPQSTIVYYYGTLIP